GWPTKGRALCPSMRRQRLLSPKRCAFPQIPLVSRCWACPGGLRCNAATISSDPVFESPAFASSTPQHKSPAVCGVTKFSRHGCSAWVELDPRELFGEDLVEVGRVGAGERIDPTAVADHGGVAGRGRARR